MREPKYSCPDIDQMKKWLKHANDELVHAIKMIDSIMDQVPECNQCHLEEAKSSIEEAQKYIDSDQQLEEIRDLNSDLRSWGSHWESEYQKLESQS